MVMWSVSKPNFHAVSAALLRPGGRKQIEKISAFGIHTFALVKVTVTAAMWVFSLAANRRSADFTNFNSYF
jgi:hypothetical protein